MLISNVSVCKNNAARVNVSGVGGFLFSCSADIAVGHGLKAGTELSDKELQEVLTEDERERAYSQALVILGRRPHSRSEIAQKLQKKDISKEAIVFVTDKLLSCGLINDAEYAEVYVDELKERCSKKAIFKKLLARGIDRGIASDTAFNCDDSAALKRAYQTACLRFAASPDKERRLKIMRSLSAKGFEYASICRIVGGVDEE